MLGLDHLHILHDHLSVLDDRLFRELVLVEPEVPRPAQPEMRRGLGLRRDRVDHFGGQFLGGIYEFGFDLQHRRRPPDVVGASVDQTGKPAPTDDKRPRLHVVDVAPSPDHIALDGEFHFRRRILGRRRANGLLVGEGQMAQVEQVVDE